MHSRLTVAVVGAGPLGTLFAAQLTRGGAAVTLVRRQVERPIERWQLSPQLLGSSWEVELACSAQIPNDVELVVVAVRGEQLTPALLATILVAQPKAIVVFSPLFGASLAHWRSRFEGLTVGMPAVAAEFRASKVNQRKLCYWQVPSTLVEQGPARPVVQRFVDTLRRGGGWVRWVPDAALRTAANTIALFPLHVAIYRLPQLRLWRADADLVQQLSASLRLARQLARGVGPIEPGLKLLVWWLGSAWRVRLFVRLALAFAPALCQFLEHHFGAKLGRQHAALAHEIQRLANERGLPPLLPAVWLAGLPSGISV